MSFAFVVYLIGTVFPAISGLGTIFVVISILVALAWICGCPFWLDSNFEDERNAFAKNTKNFAKWAIPIIFVCSLIPSKEVSYTMIAAYTAQSIGENGKVQNIAGHSLEVIEAFLEKTKKELEGEAK